MQVACLLDPPAGLNAGGDSTVELIRRHMARGDTVLAVTRGGVSMSSGRVTLSGSEIETRDDDGNWFSLGEARQAEAGEFDLVEVRFEPPVDDSFANACQLLAHARDSGARVANDPTAILTRDEKLSALAFPDITPLTLVSTDRGRLLGFASGLDGGCMVKPIGGMGGRGVFSFGKGSTNLAVVIDMMLRSGETVLVQERLKEIEEGDRRVFVIGGEPYPVMLNRRPAPGSHLGNMLAGGVPEAMEIGDAERAVCEAIGPGLRESGVAFAGVDVIGGKLTEINITCPTGLRTVRDQTGECPADDVIDAMLALGTGTA